MQKRFIFLFLISGITIGILVIFQFQTEVPDLGNFVLDELEAKNKLMDDYINEQDYLKNRIIFLRKQIDESQNLIDLQSENINLNILENLKKDVGVSEENGAGIEIFLENNKIIENKTTTENPYILASDIRDIVNFLFASHSKAISINGQRIISSSTISSVGNKILVNNSYISPPFIIRSIGDSQDFIDTFNNDPNVLKILKHRIKDLNMIFKISINNKFSVPIYNGDLKEDNISLVEQ